MEPTLYTNDVLLMERISIRLERFNKGDIVISKCPTNPKQNICKRIVGLPGDKIKNGSNVTMVIFH
jgi:inner membrane protease subunit 1